MLRRSRHWNNQVISLNERKRQKGTQDTSDLKQNVSKKLTKQIVEKKAMDGYERKPEKKQQMITKEIVENKSKILTK